MPLRGEQRRTVKDLVADSRLVFEDRGSHTLKGLLGAWQLFAARSYELATSERRP